MCCICSMYGISTKIYWKHGHTATLLHTSIPCMDHMGQDSIVMWWYESWDTSLGNTEWGTSLLITCPKNWGRSHARIASEGHVQMYVLAVFKGFKGMVIITVVHAPWKVDALQLSCQHWCGFVCRTRALWCPRVSLQFPKISRFFSPHFF